MGQNIDGLEIQQFCLAVLQAFLSCHTFVLGLSQVDRCDRNPRETMCLQRQGSRVLKNIGFPAYDQVYEPSKFQLSQL